MNQKKQSLLLKIVGLISVVISLFGSCFMLNFLVSELQLITLIATLILLIGVMEAYTILYHKGEKNLLSGFLLAVLLGGIAYLFRCVFPSIKQAMFLKLQTGEEIAVALLQFLNYERLVCIQLLGTFVLLQILAKNEKEEK